MECQELAPVLSRVGFALQYRKDRLTSPLSIINSYLSNSIPPVWKFHNLYCHNAQVGLRGSSLTREKTRPNGPNSPKGPNCPNGPNRVVFPFFSLVCLLSWPQALFFQKMAKMLRFQRNSGFKLLFWRAFQPRGRFSIFHVCLFVKLAAGLFLQNSAFFSLLLRIRTIWHRNEIFKFFQLN